MPTKAVFFDAGDTLVYRWALKAERFAHLCRQAGVAVPDDPAAVLAGARAQERFFQDRQKHDDVWTPAWYQRMNRTGLEAMGVLGDLDALATQILTASRSTRDLSPQQVDPDAIPLLKLLRSKGLRLVIVSNWDGSLLDCLQETPLPGYFDAILDSDVVGSRKPDTRIFEVACAVVGVRPEEAVHVGDSPGADVAGAQAAGVRPVLLDMLELFTDGYPGLPPFPCIRRLADLPGLLDL